MSKKPTYSLARIAILVALLVASLPAYAAIVPAWTLHDDGSFDITAGPISLVGCYPAIDSHTIFAKSVAVKRNRNAGQITYKLDSGDLILAFSYDDDSALLRATLKGLKKAPDWIYPLAQAQIKGADRLFKQGIGFAGPSGVIKFKSPVIRRESPTADEAWSLDSYMTSGILAPDNTTIAIGAYHHDNYIQRSTFCNRQYRFGLIDRWIDTDTCYYEAGFATENIPVPSTVIKLPDLHFVAGPIPFDTLRRLAQNIAAASRTRTDKPTSYHWCSWYDSEKNFSITKLDEFLTGLKTIDPPTPIMAVQIDDYCTYGDWLGENENWPDSLKPAFERILAAGYQPGIWVGPFMVDSRSHIYKEHPDWLLRDVNGVPIVHWKREGYDVLQLDSSNPDAFKYLRTVFKTLRSWGATYYKTDFMDWGLMDSNKVKRYTPGKTSVQYFVDVVKMIREEIGDDSFWLGCISPFAPMVGYVDAVRVGNDVAFAWSPGGTGNMFQESFADQYFNNVLFQTDPDVLYVRTYNCQFTQDEIYSIALWDGILGGVVNTSDMFHKVPPERLKLWRFVQPTKERRTARLPSWSRPYADQLLLVAVRDYPDRNACSILFVNAFEKQVAEQYSVNDLIGRPDAFCFEWKPGQNKPAGKLSSLAIDLKPHACVLYYLSETDTAPRADLSLAGAAIPALSDAKQ